MIPEFIKKIDWDLLREQKSNIFFIINDIEENAQYDSEDEEEIGTYQEWIDSLNGIIELINTIQDYAVDEMGMTDEEIFNLTEE